jgi:hypothetical protein
MRSFWYRIRGVAVAVAGGGWLLKVSCFFFFFFLSFFSLNPNDYSAHTIIIASLYLIPFEPH